jgi:hypothetical protein
MTIKDLLFWSVVGLAFSLMSFMPFRSDEQTATFLKMSPSRKSGNGANFGERFRVAMAVEDLSGWDVTPSLRAYIYA